VVCRDTATVSVVVTRLQMFDMRHVLGLDVGGLRRLARLLLAATCAGCGLVVVLDFVVAPLTGHFAGWFEDFGPILQAGHDSGSGADLYSTFANTQNTLVPLGFYYLPFVALLARPLAALPYNIAATIWLWIILACTISGAIIIARNVLPVAVPRTATGFCAAVLFAPVAYNVWHGQMNAVVFLALAFALRAWIRGDEVACGVALGFGAVAKVAPVLLLLLLLRRAWWRGFAAGAGVIIASLLAGGLVLGFDRVAEWFARVLPALDRSNGWYFNESLNALISRIANHNVVRVDPPMVVLQAGTLALSAGIVLAVLWCVRRGHAPPERRATEFAAGVTAMLLIGTVMWYSEYIHIAIPLLVVAGLIVTRRASRAVVAAGVAAALAAGVAAPIFLMMGRGWVPSTYGTVWWWPALQVVSVPAFTALALLVALLHDLRRAKPATGNGRDTSRAPGRVAWTGSKRLTESIVAR